MFRTAPLLLTCWAGLAGAQVKISEVWPYGGWNPEAPNADYIELFNAGATAQDLDGWSVHIRRSGTWYRIDLAGTLEARRHYLIRVTLPFATGVPLPRPDIAAFLPASALGNTPIVALMSSTADVQSCPTGNADLVDLVGIRNSTCFEGAPFDLVLWTAPNLAAVRRCERQDTENNAADFELRPPSPQNSVAPGPSGLEVSFEPVVLPAPRVPHGGIATLRVRVQVCDGASLNGQVHVDLSMIGGPADHPLLDDGVFPDEVAGDYVFATLAGPFAPGGLYPLPFVFSDAQGRLSAMVFLTRVACRADLDGDGDVDRSDLGILLSDYGCSGGQCLGDVDHDGDTDQSDLGNLVGDWGCSPSLPP